MVDGLGTRINKGVASIVEKCDVTMQISGQMLLGVIASKSTLATPGLTVANSRFYKASPDFGKYGVEGKIEDDICIWVPRSSASAALGKLVIATNAEMSASEQICSDSSEVGRCSISLERRLLA